MLRSATLALWARAWLDGHVSFDEVIDTVTGAGAAPVVLELPVVPGAQVDAGEPHARHAGPPLARPTLDRLGAVLIAWRAARADVRLVLPVAGDVRGVPGPRPFLDAALEAGEGVYGGGLGLVPLPETPGARTATDIPPGWRAFAVGAAAPDPLQLSEAEHEMAAAMRETASLFLAAGLTGGAVPATDLARARRASVDLRIPAGFPPRAAALLSQAERLQAMLALAARDPQGGGIDRAAIGVRAEALRQLAGTVRRARLAAYNAGSRG